MAIPDKVVSSTDAVDNFCDWGIVYSICALVFVLPASIALLNSFGVLAIFFYFLKRIKRCISQWSPKASQLNLGGKICFVWQSFAPVENPLNRPLQFLVGTVFVSVVFSQYPGLSIVAFVGKFLKVIFLYFSFIEVFKDEQRIRLFLGVFLLSAFVAALSGIVQQYTGKDFLRGYLIRGGRVNSTFNTANGFGAYLLPVIGLAAHFLYTAVVRRKSWILGVVFGVLLIFLLSCLCWTYSRSSWVGYLAILILMVLLDGRKILFAGALFLIFVFVFLPSLNNVRHLYLINDNTGSIVQNESLFDFKSMLEEGGSGRINFWKRAITVIQSSPVYGTGLNTYLRVIKRNPDPRVWWYAHNCYLQMAAETGLLGLISFLWVLFVLLKHGFNCCRQVQDLWPHAFLQGTLAGLGGFLVQSFFDNTFYTVQLSVLLWLTFGLLISVTRLRNFIR